MALIAAAGLSKYYGRFSAVQDLHFTVEAGSVTAFLGPNGAGKSTTMKMLTGYLAPSSGSVTIAGCDMLNDRIRGSAQLGYVSEYAAIYPDMSVRAYLRYMASLRGLHGATRDQALERACAQCFLQEVWQKPCGKLSRGFRQRVCMAQAILHQPKVLILDEPSAGLDPNQNQLLRDFIQGFAAEDRAVLLSTHILQEVEALADQVLLIHQGRLQFDGPAATLLERDLHQQFRELTAGEAH